MRQDLFSECIGNIEKNINTQYLKAQLSEVTAAAGQYIAKPIPPFRYSLFRIFGKTGSRTEYEQQYFERRRRLNAIAVGVLTDGGGKYAEALEDIIWAVCDEYTWAVPAHIPENLGVENWGSFIDLFAAETGFALSEISHLLRNKLSAAVRSRIRFEVRRRIIMPYLGAKENPFWWESFENNWSAVCSGSVGAAFLYQGEEDEIKEVLPRIKESMKCFLNSFSEDGTCLEGYGYWAYGFGFFVSFAELLCQYTNGKQDWFKWDKVKKTAMFQQNAVLNNGSVVSFSDSMTEYKHNMGLSQYLHSRFPEVIVPGVEYCSKFGDDRCYRWALFIRSLAWGGGENESKINNRRVYLDKAGWYIYENKAYSFAAKGGHNGEPHNHNDVGSFLICTNGSQIICDPGGGEYNKDYFGDKRYDFFTTSSRGHSVPIIDGNYQKAGKMYSGTVIGSGENEFKLELYKAYGYSKLKSLTRRFTLEDKAVTVSDTFLFSCENHDITERFIVTEPPQCGENSVTAGNLKIAFDAALWKCETGEEVYKTICGEVKHAYLVDFRLPLTEKSISAEFKISVL